MLKRSRSLSTLLALLSVGTLAHAADHAAGVDGVVRDPHGTPQMGVLVELMRGSVVATAFTDLQGRYHIAQVTPGIYDLRTSATLFLPTLHRSLLLRDGAASTFNLTLTGLFDETGWLTLPHKVGRGDVDEWKWTLRSPANRPMLRVVDQASEPESGTAPEAPAAKRSGTHAVLTAGSHTGGFAAVGTGLGLELGRQSPDHRSSDALLLSAGAKSGSSAASAMSLVVSRETGKGQGMQRRVLVGARSLPQLHTQSGDGLSVLEIDSAERMELGSMGAVEIGGQMQALHSGDTRVVMHPFIQASAQVNGVWLVRYQYATSPYSSSFEALDEHEAFTRTPTFVQGPTGPLTEAGSHQECAVARSLGQARLEVTGFHDAEQHAVLTGQLSRHAALPGPQTAAAGMVVDESDGSFRKLTPGFSGDGLRVSFAAPLGERGKITAAFVNGVGMGERASVSSGVTVMPRRASALYVAVRRDIPKTGTEFALSYRWQPASMLTMVGLYELSEINPYLGFHLAQSLPSGRGSAWHTELVVNANNLFAEGYRPSLDPTQDAQFMSALREVRAGLALSF